MFLMSFDKVGTVGQVLDYFELLKILLLHLLILDFDDLDGKNLTWIVDINRLVNLSILAFSNRTGRKGISVLNPSFLIMQCQHLNFFLHQVTIISKRDV